MDSTMSVAQVETETTTVTTATVTDTSTSVEETGTMDLEVRSEADTIADEIVAQNLQEQAQGVIEERVTSDNEYGNEDKLISFINFVPGFDNYRNAVIPDNKSWYAPKALYTDSKILDNNLGYTKLFDANYQNLVKIKATQPNL